MRFATVSINVILAKFQAVGQKFDINMEVIPNPARLEVKRPPSFLLLFCSAAAINAAHELESYGLLRVVDSFDSLCLRHNIVVVGGNISEDVRNIVLDQHFKMNPLVTESFLFDCRRNRKMMYIGDYRFVPIFELDFAFEIYALQGGYRSYQETCFAVRNTCTSTISFNEECRCCL